MDSGSRRVISSADLRMRETKVLIKRAHETVDLTNRRLHGPASDDPYVEWARDHGPVIAAALSRAKVDEASARVAVADQLVTLARRLIRSSRERRRLDRKAPGNPTQL